MHKSKTTSIEKKIDAVVVGAGFAGMYMVYKLRNMGLSVIGFEAGDNVGGTWYWNRYPGARCDADSVEYSYSFSEDLQQEWNWTERFATQPEILKYINHVADRFDLRKEFQFNTRVTSAHFNEDENQWKIATDTSQRITSKYCIMATGCLSTWSIPKFKGLENFKGETYHTGNWPHEGVDFSGKKVGIIGTGSSGIQSIPVIAKEAKELFVFQRTPNFTVPAKNAPLSDAYKKEVKETYAEIRDKARKSAAGGSTVNFSSTPMNEYLEDERSSKMQDTWDHGGAQFLGVFGDVLTSQETNDVLVQFVHEKIKQTVKDPETATLLTPKDYPLGTKRICVDTDYWETFNRDNVTLIDVKVAPVEEITSTGLKTTSESYDFDILVFATGFDAMTGALSKIDIQGPNGSLKEKWTAGPRMYLGLMATGFPNLFTITGPGSPSVLSNMMTSIEQHVEWIADCITHMEEDNYDKIEPQQQAEDAWVQHVNEVAHQTLYVKGNSWYLGANIPGKPRVFMPYVGGVGNYRIKCDEVAANGYEGFELSSNISLPQSKAV